jgi:hypothetical protein
MNVDQVDNYNLGNIDLEGVVNNLKEVPDYLQFQNSHANINDFDPTFLGKQNTEEYKDNPSVVIKERSPYIDDIIKTEHELLSKKQKKFTFLKKSFISLQTDLLKILDKVNNQKQRRRIHKKFKKMKKKKGKAPKK